MFFTQGIIRISKIISQLISLRFRHVYNKAVLWQRPHDAIVKFDMYRNLQRHLAVLPVIALAFLLNNGFMSDSYIEFDMSRNMDSGKDRYKAKPTAISSNWKNTMKY